jgi:serine/threonine protein kinase
MAKKLHRNAIKPGHRLHWFEIREILGQGGFGITYLARDLNLDQDVAIKEYLPVELAVREGDCSVNPLSEDHGRRYQDGLHKFIDEARTLNRFRHPNIVRVRGVFEANNTAYMVMDYEAGETLKDLLARRTALEEQELISILLPILDGLEHVHATGYVHRDLKPANVFIRADGSPVLLDFGSARLAVQSDPRTMTSLVSPGYAPIEQYYSKSDAQGPWTDIYSLGATLYRAICGRPPADAVDRSQSMLTRSRDALLSAVEVGTGRYSRRLLAAIDHALALRPEDRPRSVAEWRKELPEQAADANAECTVAATTVAGIERLDGGSRPSPRFALARARDWIWRSAVVLGVALNIAYVGAAAWDRLADRGPAAQPAAQIATEPPRVTGSGTAGTDAATARQSKPVQIGSVPRTPSVMGI